MPSKLSIAAVLTLSTVAAFAQEQMDKINITVGNHTLTATLVDNSSTRALLELLGAGPVEIHASDYAGMEKVGALPESLPQNNEPMNTVPGDVILYQGRNFVIYYGTNSWSLTPLGKIEGNLTGTELKEILGPGDVDIVISAPSSGIGSIKADNAANPAVYNLSGQKIDRTDIHKLTPGIYLINGQKHIVN